MSAVRNIRDVVSNARNSTVSTDVSRAQTPDTVPAGSRKEPSSLNPRNHIPNVMDFINKLSAATLQNPRLDLPTLLSDLGFNKGGGGSDEDDDDGSSVSSGMSFSFNMETTSTVGSFVNNRNLKSQLANFSTRLAHRSWIENHRDVHTADAAGGADRENGDTMVPYRCAAAVMFVDLSGYSAIASELTQAGGAHALSSAVNAYFEAILGVVVDQYDGEVLTFAGDAIVACWTADPGVDDLSSLSERQESATRQCCVQAAACALDLQRKCGMSPVPGTELFFRLHIGITYGEIDSQVFVCSSTQTMQKAFHFASGVPLQQTASVVNAAQQGEICVSEDVRRCSGGFLHLKEITNVTTTAEVTTPLSPSMLFGRLHLLTGIDDDYRDAVVRGKAEETPVKRSSWLENNVVPPAVAKKLKQGFKASHVAEMRFLCVLFIRKLDDLIGASEWFDEVSAILDESRCPIVQVLDDDKGMHVVAAVNLYVTERSPATVGILAARKLKERETGSAVGMACGEVFCGITGSANACRADITGPACVLAARLMQHAVASGVSTCIAPSVYASTNDVSQLDELSERVQLKGSPEPITVFTLSAASVSATAGFMDASTATDKLHAEQRTQLIDFLNAPYQRGVALVSGPVGCGKKTLISSVLQRARFMTLVHEATRERTPLNVAGMLGEWFAHHEDTELAELGQALLQSQRRKQVARTLSLSLQLIHQIIERGVRCCVVVAYAHLLDPSSMSFIKAAMSVVPSVTGDGKFYIIATAYKLYGATPVNQLVSNLQRGLTEHEQMMRRAGQSVEGVQRCLLHVQVEYAKSAAEFAEVVNSVLYFHLKPRAAQVFFEVTGGCPGLIPPLVKLIAENMLAETKKGDDSLHQLIAPAGSDGMIHLTQYGEDYLFTQISWPQLAPEVSARFTELYDALPPRYQLLMRVVASLSSTTGSASLYHTSLVMEKLNDKLTKARVSADLSHLVDLDLLKPADTGDADEYQFKVPALVDVVSALLTAEQDKTLKRIAFKKTYDYYVELMAMARERNYVPDDDQDIQYFPVLVSFTARLARAAGSYEIYKKLMAESWDFTIIVTGKDGQLRPDLRERMEGRLAQEYRRFPQHFTKSLFDKYEVRPLLDAYVSSEHLIHRKDITYAPAVLDRARQMQFPMALGAVAGELKKLLWWIVTNLLDFTNADKVAFITNERRASLAVDVDAVVKALVHFESKIPLIDGTKASFSPDAERATLQVLRTYPKDASDAVDKLQLYFSYFDATVPPRRDRIVAYVETLTDPESLHRDDATRCAAVAAAALLARPSPIPAFVVHKALLVLATSGWQPKYATTINLQSIRDAVLRQGTATALDFKAFLFTLFVFGDEVQVQPTRE